MPIIDLLEPKQKEGNVSPEKKGIALWEPILSSISSRLFFVLLFALDLLWLVFSCIKIIVYALLRLALIGSSTAPRIGLAKGLLSLKRSLVCAVSLAVAFFSPGFGVMIGCAYFLMYDKQGIEDVIPGSLKEQFGRILSSKTDETPGFGESDS